MTGEPERDTGARGDLRAPAEVPAGDDVLVPARRAPLLVYAERPRRRWAQLAADALVVGWVVVVATLATGLHDLVMRLQAPARGLAGAGAGVRDAFADAAGVAADVPLVGDRLAGALAPGVASGQDLLAAGQAQQDTVASAASGGSWLLALALLLPVVPWWLVLRVRWMLHARVALTLRDRHADADLLALQALTRGSAARLQRHVPGAADGWRRADPAVLLRLADMELGRLGLKPGRTVHTARTGPRPGV